MEVYYSFKYKDMWVRAGETSNEEVFFHLADICTILRIKHASKVASRLSAEMKHMRGKRLYVSTPALAQILRTTQRYIPEDFLSTLRDMFGFRMNVVVPSKEARGIGVLKCAFAHLNPVEQYVIGPYRADLAFVKEKIIVECDEHGHSQYDSAKEMERSKYLEARGYRIVRYNPDAQTFNIGQVIQEVLQLV